MLSQVLIVGQWLVKGNRPMPYPLKFRPVIRELTGLFPLLMCLLIRRGKDVATEKQPVPAPGAGIMLNLL